MRLSRKKLLSMITVLGMAGSLSAVSASNLIYAEQKPLFYAECEDGELSSELQITDNIYNVPKPGFTGEGFVWMQSSGSLKYKVTVPESALYSISAVFMQELSPEGRLQKLYVNDKMAQSVNLPYKTEWTNFDFGAVRLEKGENIVEIRNDWGYAYFDSITVDFADLDPLEVEPVLVDKEATPETQGLMNYLTDVYGHNMLSGQQEIYPNGHDGDMEFEFEWIKDLSGEYPAIRGFDYMNYNPLYGWDDQTTERIIDWANERNGIPTVCWHINVPLDFTSYTLGDEVDWQEASYKPVSSFDTSKAIVEGTKEYEYVQLAIDCLAKELLRVQEAGVPIIFRPYHEAEGNGGLSGENAWFWWGSGGNEVYIELWKQLYDKLTNEYDIHNLIWTYNSYNFDTSPQWYPGDDYVDIVGFDKYNTVYNRTDGLSNCPNEDAISNTFYKLVDLTDGKKLVAMTENDTVPKLDNLLVERAAWLYFCPWYMEHLMDENKNNPDTLKELYQSDYVITLDELPEWKTYKVSETPEPVETPEPTIDEVLGDVDCNGEFEIADIALAKDYILGSKTVTDEGIKNGDIASDDRLDSADAVLLKNMYIGK